MRLESLFADRIDTVENAVICLVIIPIVFLFLAHIERTKRYRYYLAAGTVFVAAAYGGIAILVADAISYRLYLNAFSLILCGIELGLSFLSIALLRIFRSEEESVAEKEQPAGQETEQ